MRKRAHERHRCFYTDNITVHYCDVYCKMDPAGPGGGKLRPLVNSTIQLQRRKCGEHFDQLSKRGRGKLEDRDRSEHPKGRGRINKF